MLFRRFYFILGYLGDFRRCGNPVYKPWTWAYIQEDISGGEPL